MRTPALIALVLAAVSLDAQSTRRLTTVDGLRRFPAYYHLQEVVVRGVIVRGDARTTLRTDESEIGLLLPPDVRAADGDVELRGTFLDVGKLEPGDPRLVGYARPPGDDHWPKPGDELVLRATGAVAVDAGTRASLRELALTPWRFEGQTLTLVGQFRGRNLYGDQPGTPRQSPHDFVLKSGEAAVWVTGLRPRGRGFDLDVDARIDTGQWLEVTGVVRRVAGLVTLEAGRLAAAAQPSDTPVPEPIAPAPPALPVEVVFSSPTPDETDVNVGTHLRVQFSRNVKPETLDGRLRIHYASETAEAPSVPEWTTRYDAGNRALEVTFAEPLEPFQTVRVELLDGILGFDGAPFLPWSMQFTVGN